MKTSWPHPGQILHFLNYGSECYHWTHFLLDSKRDGLAELSVAGDPPASPIPECRGGIETTFRTAFQSDGMRRQDTKT